jgi:hypothetical protein
MSGGVIDLVNCHVKRLTGGRSGVGLRRSPHHFLSGSRVLVPSVSTPVLGVQLQLDTVVKLERCRKHRSFLPYRQASTGKLCTNSRMSQSSGLMSGHLTFFQVIFGPRSHTPDESASGRLPGSARNARGDGVGRENLTPSQQTRRTRELVQHDRSPTLLAIRALVDGSSQPRNQ